MKLFTTKTCAYCPMVKKYLDMKGIKYEVVDTTDDPQLLREASDISGQVTVPQLLHEGEVIVGYNLPRLAAFSNKILDKQ